MHAALIILPACAHINVRDSTKRIYIVCSICNERILSPLPVLFFFRWKWIDCWNYCSSYYENIIGCWRNFDISRLLLQKTNIPAIIRKEKVNSVHSIGLYNRFWFEFSSCGMVIRMWREAIHLDRLFHLVSTIAERALVTTKVENV